MSKKRTIKASIAETKAVVTITLNPRQDTILGRMDKATVRFPDIDLTEHDALKNGVSRLHATLHLEDRMGMVQVKDLGSSNGTFLNGRRVAANEWSIVRNDDELRLGHLVMTLHFDD